jgi:hypothetical protein
MLTEFDSFHYKFMDYYLRCSYPWLVHNFLLINNILYRSYRNARTQLHALSVNAPLLITTNFLIFSLYPNTRAHRRLIKASVQTTRTALTLITVETKHAQRSYILQNSQSCS